MWKKRTLAMLALIQLGLLLLVGRLAQIQLIDAESFANHNLIAESVAQRTQELIIDDGRGSFVDRNGAPLTKRYVPSLVLFPFLTTMKWPMEQVARITGVSKEEIRRQLEQADGPFVLEKDGEPLALSAQQMKQINDLRIPGVLAVNKQYSLEVVYAPHLLGFTRPDQELIKKRYPKRPLPPKTEVGIQGLEKAFDEFLLADGETKLLYHLDAEGRPLFGLDVKYSDTGNPFYPVTVQTTLDRDLQQEMEQIVDRYGLKKGGLVLLDIDTNSVLAMVSRPNMDPRDPYKNRGAENQIVLPQIPGSIFKTVIAAAALDEGLASLETTFDCSRKIDGKTRDEEHDYGMLDLADSFAVSCNNAFATLGKQLIEHDPDAFETYARKLGLYPTAGWEGAVYHEEHFRQFPEEQKGTIWHDPRDKRVPLAVAQTAIGQKNVRVSPLGVANMMATIARGGEALQVRAVDKVLYKNGATLFSFPPQPASDMAPIAPQTAEELQRLLRSVVTKEDGTGRRFRSLPYPVAGKSGTAETGKMDGGAEFINKWFAGYFPADRPKYALAVVELDCPSGRASTNDVFAAAVEALYAYDHAKNEVK
ncbi:penicillin-binding protein 4B [Geobacillus thermopakistaniensis]|uniref:Penicillin-binding protein 4B n=1 Tax=Geobacillus thermopakistaniensis (strain MAS1) TaxID=1408282 RepID=A0A7U9P4J1_GEOTM|nr:penicillin-binding protein 2 [Geobacillus sp. MAS1]ESU70465.1 penicillin-binding protein 4B [Geobacillus sp. MAS1]